MGQKRHRDVSRQKLQQDKLCLSIVSTLTAGVISKEPKCPLLWARDALGGIIGDNLDEGNCGITVPQPPIRKRLLTFCNFSCFHLSGWFYGAVSPS